MLKGINSELGKLSSWFAHNRLTLNYSKTEFVNFSKPTIGKSGDTWDLKIDDKLIKEVNVSKFLGVYIEAFLARFYLEFGIGCIFHCLL